MRTETETETSAVANSQKSRVHDGPDLPTSDAQQIPIPVTHQSPATDRNARNPIAFADAYARFKYELKGAHGDIAYLSQRGLVNALLAMFGELRSGTDPADAISEAIHAYRECERAEREQNRAHVAAEKRQYVEWLAAETRARQAACPSCGAGPGDVCHRPNGRPAADSHRHRYRAARQLATTTERTP